MFTVVQLIVGYYTRKVTQRTRMTFIPQVELEVNSFIRGYHAYKDVWTPFIGKELLLRREPDNVKDRSAVTVLKDGCIVGHIPLNISVAVTYFLQRDYNKGFATVTGDKVNSAGYGLEVSRNLKSYLPLSTIDRFI